MNANEYEKMFSLEDHYWWFVGRRNLALTLLAASLENPGFGEPGIRGDRAGGLSTTQQIPSVGSPEQQGNLSGRVLDVGCGTGVVLRELAGWVSPIGLDMSQLALTFCQKRGLSSLIQGDGARLPLRTGSMGAIVGLDIFEHISDDEGAFAEAFRVLQPGGVLVLSVPAFKWLWGPHDVALMHCRRYRRPEVRSMLEEAGFTVERISYSVFFLFPIVVVWRLFEQRKRGPAKASLVALPVWLNQLLINLQSLETRMIASFDLPIGSSVVAVARKPV